MSDWWNQLINELVNSPNAQIGIAFILGSMIVSVIGYLIRVIKKKTVDEEIRVSKLQAQITSLQSNWQEEKDAHNDLLNKYYELGRTSPVYTEQEIERARREFDLEAEFELIEKWITYTTPYIDKFSKKAIEFLLSHDPVVHSDRLRAVYYVNINHAFSGNEKAMMKLLRKLTSADDWDITSLELYRKTYDHNMVSPPPLPRRPRTIWELEDITKLLSRDGYNGTLISSIKHSILDADDRDKENTYLQIYKKLCEAIVNYGELKEGLTQYKRLLKQQRGLLPSEHVDILITNLEIAYLNAELGFFHESEDVFAEYLPKLQKKLHSNHVDVLQAEKYHAAKIGLSGDLMTSTNTLQKLLPRVIDSLGKNHKLTWDTTITLAIFMSKRGYPKYCVKTLNKLLPKLIDATHFHHPDVYNVKFQLAVSIGKMKNYSDSLCSVLELIPYLPGVFSENSAIVVNAKAHIDSMISSIDDKDVLNNVFEKLLVDIRSREGEDTNHSNKINNIIRVIEYNLQASRQRQLPLNSYLVSLQPKTGFTLKENLENK